MPGQTGRDTCVGTEGLERKEGATRGKQGKARDRTQAWMDARSRETGPRTEQDIGGGVEETDLPGPSSGTSGPMGRASCMSCDHSASSVAGPGEC
jgi:hypothetical protein